MRPDEDEKGVERRVYERVLARCPLKYRIAEDKTLFEGSSKDISDGGIGLFTRSELAPQMYLQMWIRLSPRIKALHISGRVVWSEQSYAGLWRAGVCFDETAFAKIMKILVSKNLDEQG